MKRLFTALLTVSLIVGVSSTVAYQPAEANTKVVKYKNCTELNKVYKGGVSRSDSTVNKGGNTKHKPHVSQALYDANKHLDRDKDNIACEK